MPNQPIQILLVEDDEIDAEGVVRTLRQMKIPYSVTVVSDGLQALDTLRGEGGHPRVPRPQLILLDLNMPRMSGIEFLHALRQDPQLNSSIVFVFTTSKDEEDLLAAYAAHVAGYVLKTSLALESRELPQLIERYWRMAEFPPKV